MESQINLRQLKFPLKNALRAECPKVLGGKGMQDVESLFALTRLKSIFNGMSLPSIKRSESFIPTSYYPTLIYSSFSMKKFYYTPFYFLYPT